MRQLRVKPIALSEEQELFFIETWENNSNDTARMILHDKLGLAADVVWFIAKKLREEGKIRNKRHKKYSEKEVLAFKEEYECGRTLKEIAEAHNVGVKGVNKYLKELYGGKLPRIKATLDGEIWKDITGCSSHQVSNMGRIYVKSTNQIFYGHIYQRYRYVSINDDSGKIHHYAVHRLVAQAFIPNPDNKPEVDHIDSDPNNNKAVNLRWVDHDEQMKNSETQKKILMARERQQKSWKLKPIIKKLLEIEPDKLELVKMIINYK